MTISEQITYYDSLLEKHKPGTFQALDWKSPESQTMRFQVFEHLFSVVGYGQRFSVLDVGCGFGDLYEHLKKRGYKFAYSGYDINARVIGAAQKKHPKAHFEVKDILTDPRPERFDYIFCSGVFNIRFLHEDEHYELVKEMLLKMFEMSKRGVGVNFLSSSAVYYIKEEDLNSGIYYYFKPDEIIKYCKSFCNRYMLRHDYYPGDFTLFMLR